MILINPYIPNSLHFDLLSRVSYFLLPMCICTPLNPQHAQSPFLFLTLNLEHLIKTNYLLLISCYFSPWIWTLCFKVNDEVYERIVRIWQYLLFMISVKAACLQYVILYPTQLSFKLYLFSFLDIIFVIYEIWYKSKWMDRN